MLNNIIKRTLTTSAQQSSRTLNLGMIPGDGIGKEVIPAAQRVLEALPSQYNLKFNFIPLQAGFELFQKEGVSLPQETVDTLKNECNGAMFGAVSSPSHKVAGYSSPIVALRKKLDLYANVRPVASSNGVGANQANPIDLLIIRENTECLYIKEEELTTDENGNQVAYAKRKISKYASERAGHISFKMALMRHKLRQAQDPNNNRPPKVTITHKSNVLSITDGLWRETINQVYKDHPEYHSVQVEEQLVDSMVYRLFREPHMFDVIVAPNLYGDLLSDGAAALVGSLGLVPSANVGDNFAMGEPVHGSAPDIVGKNKANPIASIRSAALLLEQMGHFDAASSIYSAVDNTLLNGVATPDLGGKSTTTEVTESVISHLK